MDISLINSQSLLQLLSLVEKKEQTLQILEQIDAAIISALKGGTVAFEILENTESPARASLPPATMANKPVAAVESPSKAAKPARKSKAGGLKERILALLDTAGPEGLRVKDIAAKLNVKPTNVSVWFSTTGKKVTTKIEPGRFAVKGAKTASAPVIKTEEPAKPAVAKSKAEPAAKAVKPAKKSKMSAEGKARIGAAAKARWAARRKAKAAPAVLSTKPVAATKPAAAKNKGGISPEARAKMAAAAKARWAKVRSGKPASKSSKP